MYLNAVNVSHSLKMIKRKNILILRHMELLERTRLGITVFRLSHGPGTTDDSG